MLEKQLADLLLKKIKPTETSETKLKDINIDNEEKEEEEDEEEKNEEDCCKQENFENESQEANDDDVFETVIDETFEDEQESKSNEKSVENCDDEFDDKEPGGRPVYPLTPLPRPIILPGGRKWRSPKDAYNEKFIAETLISQAEVLVGSTLG